MVVGVVREWHDEEGWGVLDSDATPGGCWAYFSALSAAGYRRAVSGQSVTFAYQKSSQDGFEFVALDVTIEGVRRVEHENQPPGPGFVSRLTVEWD